MGKRACKFITATIEDILIAVTDGLKGMPEALEATFPATTLQTRIVHLIRNSLDYANWRCATSPPTGADLLTGGNQR